MKPSADSDVQQLPEILFFSKMLLGAGYVKCIDKPRLDWRPEYEPNNENIQEQPKGLRLVVQHYSHQHRETSTCDGIKLMWHLKEAG